MYYIHTINILYIYYIIYTLFFYLYPQGDQQAEKYFNISGLRVQMSYHRFINLAKLLNGYLAAKIGRGLLSRYLMDRECNCYVLYKVNGKCVNKGKCRNKCLIYEVNAQCVTLCIWVTHSIHSRKEFMAASPISYVSSKTEKPDSFADHFE